jgi:hypothetical protein
MHSYRVCGDISHRLGVRGDGGRLSVIGAVAWPRFRHTLLRFKKSELKCLRQVVREC